GGCLALDRLARGDVPALHALLLVVGEVRRGCDLLDPAPAGDPARHVLRQGASKGDRGPVTREGKGAMSIVFFCQSCGARFELDPRMAGKRGHCKKCGQIMTIPRAEEIASMTAMPALAMAGAGAGVAAGSGPDGAAVGRSFASLLRAGISSAALAPITL